MFRGQEMEWFGLQQLLQISMTLAWRQGMNQEVKKKVISMLTSEERIELKDQYFKYLKYSQFYKICINKYGSKCPKINEGFKDQEQYFQKLQKKFCGMRDNISSFMFGITKMPSSQQRLNIITIKKEAANIEDFKKRIDDGIELFIKMVLVQLNQKYSIEQIKTLKEKINEMMTFVPQNQQSFKQSQQKWQSLITQVLNFNCLQQVINEIHATYTNITTFRSELSQNSTIIHGQRILNNLYNYGLTHKQTQYNITCHGK